MANFAVINGNKIVNIIVAESLEDAEKNVSATCVQILNEPGSPDIGWTYNLSTETFAAPETIN